MSTKFKFIINTRILTALAVLLLLGGTLGVSPSRGDNRSDVMRRQLVGLRFFPNVIAVDEGIEAKQNKDGNYVLLFVYNTDRKHAEMLAERLKLKAIKKVPVEIVVTDAPKASDRPAGIFLTEWLPEQKFNNIVRFGMSQNVIVFSPFVGDVERGATAGLNISTKIRPSLNLSTLKRSNIKVNKVFLRLSKHYD